MSPTYPFDVDPGPVVPYKVIPLSNLDEQTGFFVEGTDDEAVARRQIELHLEAEYVPHEAEALRRALAKFPIVDAATDWKWEPGPDPADDYEYLVRDSTAPTTIVGVRFGFTVDVEYLG